MQYIEHLSFLFNIFKRLYNPINRQFQSISKMKPSPNEPIQNHFTTFKLTSIILKFIS